MLRKGILICGILAILSVNHTSSDAREDDIPLIIPRASWGANSLYNDINSEYWKSILKARADYIAPYKSPEIIAKQQEKTQKINNYFNTNYSQQFHREETIATNAKTGVEYAWDLSYASKVDAIVVHHTHSEYDDDLTGMQQIHKYHSLNRQWGDIGYHYVIGYDGVVYEGREGGDYVVGAHSTYNNIGTVGIAVLGNYESHGINTEQYASLEQLIRFITKKYGIDLSKKRYYHMACGGEKCDVFPIETYLDSVLIGHRDATHTDCPGEKLYEQIQQIRSNNLTFTEGFQPVKRGEKAAIVTDSSTSEIQIYLSILQKYSRSDLEDFLPIVNQRLSQDMDSQRAKQLRTLRLAIILSLRD